MNGLIKDIRHGVQTFLRVPGFAAAAVLTLALGIGANTTIFSWINSTLLNPIPGLSNSNEVVSITRGDSGENPAPLSYPDYLDLRDRNRSFSDLIGFNINQMTLSTQGKPERIWGGLTSANYFGSLGIRPVLGRTFQPVEDQTPGGAAVAVISYRLWQSHFAGDNSVIGRSISINRHPYSIIGVAPPVFQGTQTGLRIELWIPVSMQPQASGGVDRLHDRNESWLMVLGRLKPRVPSQQAQQELNVLMKQIAAHYPDSHKSGNQITLYPLWRAPYGANAYLYVLLPMLMAIAGVVLLLACANVANLVLVRSVSRRREIAIRLSLGATRWRLVRQLLAESAVLALAGGVVAVVLTFWTAGALEKFIPATGIPISMEIHADRNVLLAALVISVITGLIFGAIPALRSSRLSPVSVLKEEAGSASGGRHKARLSSSLAVAQISLSLLLLICAGLFIRSFSNAQKFDPGFNAEHVLLAAFSSFAGDSSTGGPEFNRQLLARLEALPGVESVSLADWVPLGFTWSSTTLNLEGYAPKPNESMDIFNAGVAPNYFRTMQIPLVAGREFSLQDTEKTRPVLIVNQALVDRYWPGQDAIGKRVGTRDKSYTVIGVARNSSYSDLGEAPQPFVYLPLLQDRSAGAIIHARVSGNPLSFSDAVEKTVHQLNADLPVFDVTSLKSRVGIASTGERIAGTFVGAFGLVALVLAVVGIYGVVAYTTRQRTREIGIRIALGAQKQNVFLLVVGQGIRLTLVGIILGLAAAFALTRFLASLLFGVTATDALTFFAVALLLSTASLAACYLPARRATRVDPIIALRYE